MSLLLLSKQGLNFNPVRVIFTRRAFVVIPSYSCLATHKRYHHLLSAAPFSISSKSLKYSPLSVSKKFQYSSHSPSSSSFSSSRTFVSYDGVHSSNNIPSFSSRRPLNYGICMVPQQSAWVIERFGKFHRILSPGLHFLIPLVDKIAYVHSLKEQAIPISNQQAITMDNVTINIDGVLYLRVIEPEKSSYGVSDIYYAMTQLAQTTMRSELGKITLDQTFANRESLNQNIVHSINSASEPWGVRCLRYEIRDITPPQSVKYAMDMQAEAERKKRATILDSEGSQQAEINVADGQRQATILAAQGEAAAIIARAEATAKGIDLLAKSINELGGKDAVSLRIAEQHISAFGNIAKAGNTILLPANTSDPANMIVQALAIFNNITRANHINNNNNNNDNLAESSVKSGFVPSPQTDHLSSPSSFSSSNPSQQTNQSSSLPYSSHSYSNDNTRHSNSTSSISNHSHSPDPSIRR